MGAETGVRRMAGATALVVVVAGVTACSSSKADEVPGPRTSESGPATGGAAATDGPPEAPPTRYQPDAAEVDGAAKRAAARAVEALPDVRQVTYTQYFGYLPPQASILVEADFVDGGGTTYDVRITRDGDRWRVNSVTAAQPAPPLEDPGPLARRVLDSDRIVLPWAGRVDIAAGLVSDAVLRSMLEVAEHHRIGISVLVSAHPVHVFGTDRRSNHPDGQAYDIGSIGGRLVVDPAAAGLVREVMRLAAASGAYQVGGPDDLDDAGSQYFSDPTHSDHVHAGFGG